MGKMTEKVAIGGASGAVVTSAHAGCERFRGTDPIITGQSRRNLAKTLGAKDTVGSISKARWTRANTFESLVHNPDFAGRIVANTVGGAGLPKPTQVQVLKANEDASKTLEFLRAAIESAKTGVATLIQAPAVPPPNFAVTQSTLVLPDFVVVTSNPTDSGKAWLIIGDAKDYERTRSRIDDARMLKGFIQVAFGAFAFEQWDERPKQLEIHPIGALAVPRNSFLQPTIVTETLTDHIKEVQLRYQQRLDDAKVHTWNGDAVDFVNHLKATYDPSACRSCSLFDYCRGELRASSAPEDFLQEIGVPKSLRPLAVAVLVGEKPLPERLPTETIAHIEATLTGLAVPTGRRRTDPVGTPGTVNVVIAKSDNAALGVYGIGTQFVNNFEKSNWIHSVLETPEADSARRQVMQLMGEAIRESLRDSNFEESAQRINIVTPDKQTTDLLASIADVLAGQEISRLRWQRDVEMGREPVTFDGSPANIPIALTPQQRLAVSFLLEDDRARAFSARATTVNLLSVLSELLVAGGPNSTVGRLDYMAAWVASVGGKSIDYKTLLEEVESNIHTPGARLSQMQSDQIHATYLDKKVGKETPAKYEELVRSELLAKQAVFDLATKELERIPISNLREAIVGMEADAQKIWHRRWKLQAFDLVRFGLTSRWWRNSLVPVVDGDQRCIAQMTAVLNPMAADAQAKSAGNRDLTIAKVVALEPLTLSVASRRFKNETKAFVLHRNGIAEVESRTVVVRSLKGQIKVTGLIKGQLVQVDDLPTGHFLFDSIDGTDFALGDYLVLAADDWIGDGTQGAGMRIEKPAFDSQQSPKESCNEASYLLYPEEHKYCCRPHLSAEAETSDWIATKREAGEMNPQAWPPVIDAEAFDQLSPHDPTDQTANVNPTDIPDGLTEDDLN
jgi:hypothetical protein